MRHTFELGPYRIEVKYSSKTKTWTGHPWTHVKLHREYRSDPWFRHLVWGRVSIAVDTPDQCTVSVCAECDSGQEPATVSAGDESWSVCEACRSVEGRTEDITVREYERING